MKLKWNSRAYLERELYVGLFSTGLGLFLMTAPDRNTDMYRIYPKAVFSGLVVMGALMVFGALFVNGGNNISKARIHSFEVLILAVVLASRMLIGSLGLYSSVFLVTLAVSLLFQRDRSVKKLASVVVFHVILIAVLYGVFGLFLKVNAPKGLLF